MSRFSEQLDHPLRVALSNEVHARPPDAIPSPCALSYFARVSSSTSEVDEYELLSRLLAFYDVPPPAPDTKQLSLNLNGVRMRWERHTEFARYTLSVFDPPGKPFERPPIDRLPAEWLDLLKESVLVAVHTHVGVPEGDEFSLTELSEEFFSGNVLVGAHIASGAAVALTDFRIHEDGFSRMMVLNFAMTSRQTGRMIQRLLESDTYRMMTLLALPMAQSMAPELAAMEAEIGSISTQLADGGENEQELLERIFLLAAQSEASQTRGQFRFSAADAYYRLVCQRTVDLRESRIKGVQTFEEFNNRRLTPAVDTCRSTAARQKSVADRTERAAQLISTRVDVGRQQQNQSLLYSMNERAKMQLRLQATVEGLSVAAITYYVVGLIQYLTQGMENGGLPVNASLLTAVSIPFVAVAIFFGVRRVRRHLAEGQNNEI